MVFELANQKDDRHQPQLLKVLYYTPLHILVTLKISLPLSFSLSLSPYLSEPSFHPTLPPQFLSSMVDRLLQAMRTPVMTMVL